MEIIAALLGGLIAATLTVIIMGTMSSYAISQENEQIRQDLQSEIEEEQEKCNRYRETLDGFIERHNALKEKLSEKDKEISKLKYHLKTAEKVIGLIEDEPNALEPMTEKAQNFTLRKTFLRERQHQSTRISPFISELKV